MASLERTRELAAKRQAEYRARHKAAIKERVAADKNANPEKYAAYKRKCHEKNPVTRLVQLARSRAKARGLDFNISAQDFDLPTHCPVLGIPLFLTENGFSDNAPTIDREDNTKGYVKGNCIIVSWRANRIKADATPEELRTVADFYEARRAH